MPGTDSGELLRTIAGVLGEVLPDGLPPGWPGDRPLVDAGLDSVAMLELVTALEARFGVRFAPEDMDAMNFGTLDAIAALLARRIAGR